MKKKLTWKKAFFWFNTVVAVITIGTSLLLWFDYISTNWINLSWDERALFVFLPAHGLGLIVHGLVNMLRIKKKEEADKKDGERTNSRGEDCVDAQVSVLDEISAGQTTRPSE